MKARRCGLIALAVAMGALAVPSAAQAVPLTNVTVAFGVPPGPNTIAGDEVEYLMTFTAGQAFNSDLAQGSAIIVNAAGAPPFASGTQFPPSALHEEGGAFYTIGTASDPGNVVVAPVTLLNGNQTVAIPVAFTGVTVNPGDTVTVGIGFGSEGKVQNRLTACDDCVIAVDTNRPGDDFGVSNTFDVNVGPGDLLLDSGNDQETAVGTAFGSVLKAKVVDGLGAAVSGATVTFTAPGSGASGTFADGNGLTDDDVTDASGIAESSVLTANGDTGIWSVEAESDVVGVNTVEFDLENNPGAPDEVSLELSPTVIPGNGVSTSQATATVIDVFDNPVSPGQTVTFSTDGNQDISDPPVELSGGRYRATITSSPESDLAIITVNVAEGSAPSDTAPLTQTADLTAPEAEIRDHPKKKFRKARARFSFDEGGSDVAVTKCKLDGRAYQTCNSPKTYRVSRGKHTFRVRSTDFAGNTGPPDSFKFERKRKRR